MPELNNSLTVILLMTLTVYSTRVCGYFIGQKLRHISNIKPLLEALPGCAMMAILVPAVRNGSIIDILALTVVLGLMWKTNNVVISSIAGMGILLFGQQLLEMIR